ncbi:MAG: tetratricopeptide repeat protein [Flavobacteriaceae bacterium]|tara:strand:- start:24 stop:1403 length:1380 start_codon:yes stop_codon:yes gene_type:complete
MNHKNILIVAFLSIFLTPGFTQNQEDIQTLSIFSEYVKSKNYDAAYTPWMELRKRNPRFNKAIFIYGERILKDKIKKSSGEEKVNFINDMLALWEERAHYFAAVTPKGTYMAKACQLRYDNRQELGINKVQLHTDFSEAYNSDPQTFTNPKSLYTYFSLVVDMYDAGNLLAQELFNSYEVVSEKVENEVKNYTNKRNAFLNEEGATKELSRTDESRLKSYNSYLKAYEQISSSIDVKLGSRANCENLIALYRRDFQTFKNDGLWLQRAMNRMYAKGCNEDPLFVKIVEQKNNIEPNADTSFYLGLLKEKSAQTDEALVFYNQAVNLETDEFAKAKILFKIATNFKKKGRYAQARTYYKKTLNFNPSMGRSYLAIAAMYAKSANNCGMDNFSKRAVYWLAAREAAKASRVDPNMKKNAAKSIANFKAKAPQKSEIFSSGRAGETINIGCWIQRSVTVPNL